MDLAQQVVIKCYHCGQACEEVFLLDQKNFCCYGCQTVYEILNENNLCTYYNLSEQPGISLRKKSDEDYTHLNEEAVRKKIIAFDSKDFARVVFNIPSIHCASCIWLLENLQKIDRHILKSEVNFGKKSVTVDFNPEQIKLSNIASLLNSLGYAPQINLDSVSSKETVTDKSLLIKLAIAGFCFGNVMLFSFPEYLGIDSHDELLKKVFSCLNIALSIPVLFYSGFDYIKSATKSFNQKQINIDVPIALGLITLFSRSVYDIVMSNGAGYLDSFTGLVFFLLIGRWFQSKTYESLAFDRDYKSYFPLAVQKLSEGKWISIIIYNLNRGDKIKIRNMEIVPADSFLLDDEAFIDYSFVTGESRPTKVKLGELVYAGGRLIGQPVTMTVDKKTSQSHLTSLWNNVAFNKTITSKYKKIIDNAALKFTWIVLGIAALTAIYWQLTNPSQTWLVLTSVLMVACPCALALAVPFTYGNMMRVFGKNNFYLKNADVIERLAAVDAIVFDKTGTITHGDNKVEFIGQLSDEDFSSIKLLTSASTHPLSAMIAQSIKKSSLSFRKENEDEAEIFNFKEIPGKGIQGIVNEKFYQIGSSVFLNVELADDWRGSTVFVSIDGELIGYFLIRVSLRKNIKNMIERLGNKVDALLSGDKETQEQSMRELFGNRTLLFFNQTPHNKLDYVYNLQQNAKTVLMVGDGLNDAGALKQSDVGIAVTDDTGVFTPACDAILDGKQMPLLDKFIELSKSSTRILKAAFVISFLYNGIALSFAVSGHLTPLVAAVLMPLSSISVVGFSTFATNIIAKQKLKNR